MSKYRLFFLPQDAPPAHQVFLPDCRKEIAQLTDITFNSITEHTPKQSLSNQGQRVEVALADEKTVQCKKQN